MTFGVDIGEIVALRDGIQFGSGGGSIFLDDVVCKGNEANLLQCSHRQQHNCQESDVVGVICGGNCMTE